MTSPEPQPSAKPQTAARDFKLRHRLHKAAAGLTHALFALTIALTFVRNDTPTAAATDPQVTAAAQDRLPQSGERLPGKPAEGTGGITGQAEPGGGPEQAAADPEALTRGDASTGPDESAANADADSGGVVVALRSRRQKQEHAEPATPARPATDEEKARFKPLLDRLVAAYPDFLTGHDETEIIWKDGTRTPFDDGRQKTLEGRLADADLDDQMLLTYTPGPVLDDPLVNFDPGRIRSEAFFRKMYGDCKKGEVQKRLVPVDWLPKHGGKPIKVTPINGVADKLRLVSDELDALGPEFIKYVQPISGTFNCRNVSQTDRSSAHGFGIAIDINAKFGDYWQWRQPKRSESLSYRNQIPWEIVAIFEKHGFIWGGKWYHFDTAHFEYRPELIVAAEAASPQTMEAVPMPEKQPRNLN